MGFEVGESVITGGELREDDWLYQTLCDHGSKNGRSSWNPMLVLLALTGNAEKAGYSEVKGFARVDAYLSNELGSGWEWWHNFYEFHKLAIDELEAFDYEEYKKNGFKVNKIGDYDLTLDFDKKTE